VGVRAAVAADAGDVLTLIREAFGARPVLDPPAPALAETHTSVSAALAGGALPGGLIALEGAAPVGSLLLEPGEGRLWLRRVAVLPSAQGRGVAAGLVTAAEELARRHGYDELRLVARVELPATVHFWQHRGYAVVDRDGPELTLAKAAPVEVLATTAEQARTAGERLAGLVRAGDLGAGKTTFTQGLGSGLGVRGTITSPTFVISRVHPSVVGGPALVHVDAYRLGGAAELDDLDLDAALDQAVTVVEWGEGLAESLTEDRLEVTISRARGDAGTQELQDLEGDEPRQLRFSGIGARWLGAGLREALA
jgi:tRNA threonylcarbamoyladenosine biosynthesis protein TsaE